MSPFMALIVLAVLIGVLVLLVGLVLRKRVLIFIGAPAGFLLVVWLLLASHNPNPETEFSRIFGSTNRAAASDIRTIKPTFMDGHFISFHISQADFDSRILPQFTTTDPRDSNLRLLHNQPLPKGWPEWIESLSSIKTKEVNHQQIIMVYGSHEQTAYASVEYEQW
jgi:hypothetical protein